MVLFALNHLFFHLKRRDNNKWPKNFFAANSHYIFYIQKDSRCDAESSIVNVFTSTAKAAPSDSLASISENLYPHYIPITDTPCNTSSENALPPLNLFLKIPINHHQSDPRPAHDITLRKFSAYPPLYPQSINHSSIHPYTQKSNFLTPAHQPPHPQIKANPDISSAHPAQAVSKSTTLPPANYPATRQEIDHSIVNTTEDFDYTNASEQHSIPLV